jgi:hypothetical protein
MDPALKQLDYARTRGKVQLRREKETLMDFKESDIGIILFQAVV